MRAIRVPLEFEWDSGNRGKNVRQHGVTDEESEGVFFDPGKKILKDTVHSGNEARYILIGQTRQSRILFTVFTIRKKKIRIISSRSMNKKERHLYEKKA